MPLFQKSVLNKYLKEQEKTAVEKAYDVYYNYFHNPEIQRNIYASKEEQFQEGFLRELFVNVFGFVLNPNPDFNLTTEFKNEKGAKKADGAILSDGKAIAVIELKSTKTKDLESIRQQAFDYKANQSECVYVITSNFQKLRFYINNAVEFEEFDLFALSKERFEVLHLCLNSHNLLANLALKIKNASLLEEESITKKFYADYSLFKKELFEDIAKRNTEMEGVSKLQLYKKTQKLLDRFLFIFFAEDRGLLPPNSISRMIKRWNVLNDEDAYKPLYEIYKQYFGYLNTGRAGKVSADDIQAYNGGLFLPDEILDDIEIDDAILLKHTSTLTNYDFDSQVDVNILGHIFEHSLNEIETTTAELEGVDFDKQKSKRKKDGVFYTPKYITKYIVDNTVGKLCEEKKTELSIKDDEFTPNRKKETKKKLLASLEAYRKWLLELTICDPACGSGAFLNQTLEYLINEHHFIDGLNAQLFGSTMVFQDVENQILENNIFGVDINEESVDIARLSLWLRTAQRGRKLTTLNKNIKCGNSLIDDPEVAGDKAFNWEKEFPEVFAEKALLDGTLVKSGGFDVVIGNPPYVRQELFKPYKPYFESKFQTYQSTADLFTYFIELGVDKLLNKKGIYSVIVANKWMRASYGRPLRQWMKQKEIVEIIDFGDLPVFSDATTYPCILTLSSIKISSIFRATEPDTLKFSDLKTFRDKHLFKVSINSLDNDGWTLVSKDVGLLLKKLKTKGIPLNEYIKNLNYRGVLTGCNEAFIIDEETKQKLILEDTSSKEIIKPFISGKDVKALQINKHKEFLIFAKRNIDIDKYPAILNHLTKYKDRLTPKPKDYSNGDWKGRKSGSYKWYEIQDTVAYSNYFDCPKIIYPEISAKPAFALDLNNVYPNKTAFIIPIPDKFLLGVLNSSVVFFLFRNILPKLRGDYYSPSWVYFKTFPIVVAEGSGKDKIKKIIELKVSKSLGLRDNVGSVQNQFVRYLIIQLKIEIIPNKLQNWHELEFGEFIKELNKVIKKSGGEKLSKMDEMEWMEVFETKKAEAQTLKAEIDKTDKQIDQLVYELYGLTEEEIKIIECSNY